MFPVLCLTYSEVLDPRISYDGMKLDYEDNISLTEYLESAKLSLHTYFSNNYAGRHVAVLILVADMAHTCLGNR